jgi:TetR/AcrR family transcriptional regulator, cholesterol catabolism regulator
MAQNAVKRRKDEARPAQSGGTRPTGNASSDRRARILEAAMHRFADFGFESTTVRQIGDDVNILSGSLYHHFATKDEMLHEIVRDAVGQLRNNALRISRTAVDAEQRLVALILLDLGEITRNQKVHAILTNERRLFRQKEEFAYVLKAKRETYQAWRAVVQDGIDSKLFKPDIDVFLTILTIIRMLNTAADWYRNDEYVSGKGLTYTLDQVIDFHLDFILSAIRLPSRTAAPIPRQQAEVLAKFRD